MDRPDHVLPTMSLTGRDRVVLKATLSLHGRGFEWNGLDCTQNASDRGFEC